MNEFNEFSPKQWANFSRIQSKAVSQFLDELGKKDEFLASRESSILGIWAAPGPPGPP